MGPIPFEGPYRHGNWTQAPAMPSTYVSLVLCLYTLHLKLLPDLHVRMAGYAVGATQLSPFLLTALNCLSFLFHHSNQHPPNTQQFTNTHPCPSSISPTSPISLISRLLRAWTQEFNKIPQSALWSSIRKAAQFIMPAYLQPVTRARTTPRVSPSSHSPIL